MAAGHSRWSARYVRPMIPFMGVRISWLMVARNSLLARVASKASCWLLSSSALRAASSAVRVCTCASSSAARWRVSSASCLRAWLSMTMPTRSALWVSGLIAFCPLTSIHRQFPLPSRTRYSYSSVPPASSAEKLSYTLLTCSTSSGWHRSRKSGSVMCSTPSGQPSIRQTCSL